MKALLKVGYGCNDHCTFCHTLPMRETNGSAAEVHAKIDRAKALGHTMVVLSGGEPTIRPEIFRWAEHVVELGMDFGLVTNGRMLSYPEFTEKLLALRLRYVYLSLHGGTAKVHNSLVRSQAFAESYGAFAQLTGKGLDLHANCVVTKQNVKHLRGVVDAMLPYPDVSVKFSMVEPKGGGDVLFRRLMPRVEEVAEAVCDAIAYGDEKTGGEGPHFAHGALPLCLMPGLEHRYDDLKTHRFATMIEVGEGDYFPVDDRNKVQPEETCAGCGHRGPCPGLYRGYEEEFGFEELKPPAPVPRSNSYNYTFERLVGDGVAEERCLLRDGQLGVTPWDQGRHLFVRRSGRWALYRADSRDFNDAEMATLKNELGQVYVDASRKAAPTDFARDLVKLEQSSLCGQCSEREHCAGVFEPRFENVFGRDDAAVVETLKGFEGRVLDVGCGEGPYLEELAEGIASGRLEYVGVDPDSVSLGRFRVRLSKALAERGADLSKVALHVAGVDELGALDLGSFDGLLVLRSWNHLPSPERALAAWEPLLRQGAEVLVVDNIAFGLARSQQGSARGESGPAVFEHYRNDGAAEAAAVFGGAYRLEERRDVGPLTSNQWLLRYRWQPQGSPSNRGKLERQ